MAEKLESRNCGHLPGGETVDAFVLEGAGGVALEAITLGGIVTRLLVPDQRGNRADVVLGFADLAGYLRPHPYFGAIAGRVAGRISGSRFTIDGQTHSLSCNEPPNHLHGGARGFDKRLWSAQPVARADGAPSLRLSRISPNGEEGYPGNLRVSVTYAITARNEFIIDSEATTDRPTPISLTHHSYFNLSGEGSSSVAHHKLQIMASRYAPTDSAFAFIGRRDAVDGNDFRAARRMSDAIPHLYGQHGDLYFIDRPAPSPATLVDAAQLIDPSSGRVMTVRTTEACIQLYTGTGLDGSIVGKSGRPYGPFAGMCLECEGFPDGANRPDLGNVILRPGGVFRQTTVYAFSTL
ncbi:MAG TPA: aldose epimerase family protein [Tepidisphaeraceae bacterium]|nr:aldose epimerase family protein [Tepidisphaeraceae bacterium]